MVPFSLYKMDIFSKERSKRKYLKFKFFVGFPTEKLFFVEQKLRKPL